MICITLTHEIGIHLLILLSGRRQNMNISHNVKLLFSTNTRQATNVVTRTKSSSKRGNEGFISKMLYIHLQAKNRQVHQSISQNLDVVFLLLTMVGFKLLST